MTRNITLSLALLGTIAIATGCQQADEQGQASSDMTDTCDPTLICGQALTCVDGHQYPTICGPDNCDEPLGPCDDNVCGAMPGMQCGAGEFCNFADACDRPGATGACVVHPDSCPTSIDPVCGCDDLTYDNECFAHMAGVSVQFEGQCEQTAS